MSTTTFRQMRVVVLFDLPSVTSVEKKNYRKYVKELKRAGFTRLQYSIYMRYTRNYAEAERYISFAKKMAPCDGNIRILTVTEKQYEDMELVIGTKSATEEVITKDYVSVIE